MLFFALPIDDEEEEPKSSSEKKRKPIDPNKTKKFLIGIIVVMTIICILIIATGIFLKLKPTPTQNISPYCLLMKEQGRICKIHQKRHDTKGTADITIPEEDMAFHQELADAITNGAYFDGKKLYKKENAEEILKIRDNFTKEKATLFDGYLAGTLTEEEKVRYNFLIEELVALEEVIVKLDIQVEDKEKLNNEELNNEELIKEVKVAETTSTEMTSAQKTPVQQVKQVEDPFLYVDRNSKEPSIPKDIEKAATIKKSSLYN